MNISTNIYPEVFPDLNVAEVDVVSGAAGPGLRLVIWLQGCLKRCPGCANGPFLPLRAGRRISVSALSAIAETCHGIDGITLSGGEPVLQAEALIPFLKLIRLRDLTAVCYTGYTIEELQAAGLQEFLSHIDLLVDGEYRSSLPRGGPYRPSANQRLHYLSGRIRAEQPGAETVIAICHGLATITGTLPDNLRRELSRRLEQHGIVMRMS